MIICVIVGDGGKVVQCKGDYDYAYVMFFFPSSEKKYMKLCAAVTVFFSFSVFPLLIAII